MACSLFWVPPLPCPKEDADSCGAGDRNRLGRKDPEGVLQPVAEWECERREGPAAEIRPGGAEVEARRKSHQPGRTQHSEELQRMVRFKVL